MRMEVSSASSEQPGDGPGHFARPKGIAIDSDGHIWVADEVQSRVQVYDKEGQLLIYFGEHGWYPGQFQALYGIAADNHNNRIITSEQFPGRVQVFRYITDAEAKAERDRRAAAGKRPSLSRNPPTPRRRQRMRRAKRQEQVGHERQRVLAFERQPLRRGAGPAGLPSLVQ